MQRVNFANILDPRGAGEAMKHNPDERIVQFQIVPRPEGGYTLVWITDDAT